MRFLLLLAFCLSAFFSCKKAEPTVTREDELREGKWKIANLTMKVDPYIGKDTLIQVYDSVFKNCNRDDYLVFKSNYQGTQNNAEKCGPGEADEVPFRWELADNGDKINFWYAENTFFGKPDVSAPFLSYTENSFVIRYQELVTLPSTHQDTFTLTYTFQKF